MPDSKIYHIGGGTTTGSEKEKKRIKNNYIMHFHKNKLMMLLKNNSSSKLFFLIPIYLFDLTGYMLSWIYDKQPMFILLALKGIIWNIKNLRNILSKKRQFINDNMKGYSFLHYYGIWKTIFIMMKDYVVQTFGKDKRYTVYR